MDFDSRNSELRAINWLISKKKTKKKKENTMQQKKREERYPKKYTEAEPGRERGGWLIKANDLEY